MVHATTHTPLSPARGPVSPRPVWEYAELVVVSDPANRATPVTSLLFFGDGREATIEGDNVVIILSALGRNGWELLGVPDVRFRMGATLDEREGRDQSEWSERRFWLKRLRES